MTVFELAELIEQTAAEIYKMLAARFEDKPNYRALFTLLAHEERAHGKHVKEIAAKWDEGEDGAGWSMDFEESHLQQLLEKAEDVLAMVLQRTNLPEKEALEIATEIEVAFKDAHASALAADLLPELKELFAELEKHDVAHIQLIARASEGNFPPPPPTFGK